MPTRDRGRHDAKHRVMPDEVDTLDRRPAGADDSTVHAAGKLSGAAEWLKRAQGRFYDFHQMMGRVDFPMGDAATMLRYTGQPQAAPTRQPPSMSSTRLIRPKTRQEPTHNVRSTISASVNCSCISIQRSSPMARWSDANRVA